MGYVTHVGMRGLVPLSMLTPLRGSPSLTRGTTSKSDHIEFELRPVFAKWTLDNVTEAITRCEQLQRSFSGACADHVHSQCEYRWQSFHSRHSCFLLTRRVFFEVFSDYGVVDEDGNFLSIPLHVFSAFDPRK